MTPATPPDLREALARLKTASDNASPGTAYPCSPPWFQNGDGVLIGSPDPQAGRLIADTDTSGFVDDRDGTDDEPNAVFIAEAWNFARLTLGHPEIAAEVIDRATLEARIKQVEAERVPCWNDAELDADPQKMIAHLNQQCRDFIRDRDEWKEIADRRGKMFGAATARADALERAVTGLGEALKKIAEASPEADDMEWYDPAWGDPEPYRCESEDGSVHETRVKDNSDLDHFGYHRGLHAAALIARAALAQQEKADV